MSWLNQCWVPTLGRVSGRTALAGCGKTPARARDNARHSCRLTRSRSASGIIPAPSIAPRTRWHCWKDPRRSRRDVSGATTSSGCRSSRALWGSGSWGWHSSNGATPFSGSRRLCWRCKSWSGSPVSTSTPSRTSTACRPASSRTSSSAACSAGVAELSSPQQGSSGPLPPMVFPSIVSSVRLLAVATLSAAAVACASPTTYDLILRGGTIVDGTGTEPYIGDVAISGDRIAAVGQLGRALGLDEIDATGLMVAPGFINMHSHARAEGLPTAVNMLSQGVTTEILGSIRVSQRHFGAFRGFAWVIRWESPCGSSWKTRSVFQGAVGAFGASTVPSASTGPVRVRQDDSQGGGGPPRPRTAVDR